MVDSEQLYKCLIAIVVRNVCVCLTGYNVNLKLYY